MEILSYLNQQGRRGEIIHGSIEYIAERIGVLAKVAQARKKLQGARVGVIGRPSDWLISSVADPAALSGMFGIELVDIPISELVEEYASVPDSSPLPFVESLPEGLRKYGEGSCRIYLALQVLIERYSLSGLTLRCFDLLDAVSNTGCLALAMLNAEGIPAGCEGDVPALVSMMVGNALTGVSGFQSNPSRIDPESGEMLFAHCTIPLNMVSSFTFNTHFESGIGIAISGHMPEGDVTIFKLSGDLTRSFSCEAELLRSQSESGLCRTQAVLKIKEQERMAVCRDYFLKSPVGNHHIIFPGAVKHLFDAFLQVIG
jgi:L-fucose isomerase-like protein